jgi:hypothetical protein
MPAYWISIIHHCAKCGGRATQEVFTTYNSSLGYFCLRCARAKAKELTSEDEQRRQRDLQEAG